MRKPTDSKDALQIGMEHQAALAVSNKRMADLFASDSLNKEEYFFDGKLPENEVRQEESERIRSYFDLEDEPYLMRIYDAYKELLHSFLLGIDYELEDPVDYIDLYEVEGFDQAIMNKSLSQKEIIRMRSEVCGLDYSGLASFQEVMADLRGNLLMMDRLIPRQQARKIAEAIFYKRLAKLMVDHEHEIPTEIKFKLSKKVLDSLPRVSAEAADAMDAIKVIQESNQMRERTEEVLNSGAHPKIVARATKLIPDQVLTESRDMRAARKAEKSSLAAKFFEEFDFKELSKLFEAITGFNRKDIFPEK